MLVVNGDEDEACLEPGLMVSSAPRSPAAGLAVMPDSGHGLDLEEPELFNDLIRARWSAPPRPAPGRPGPCYRRVIRARGVAGGFGQPDAVISAVECLLQVAVVGHPPAQVPGTYPGADARQRHRQNATQ